MNTSSIFCKWPVALFAVALCLNAIVPARDTAAAPAKFDAPVKPVINGKFLGNGKPAALRFISVWEYDFPREKQAVKIILTEKKHPTDKNPQTEAFFGDFGSALILSVYDDGEVFGCEVHHTAHKKKAFSSAGRIRMLEYKIAGGNVSGHVTTDGEFDSFGDKWDVDLTFAAPLPEKLRAARNARPKPAASTPPPAVEEAPAKPAGSVISAKSLPLPMDAKDVQFKPLMEQIGLTSGKPVTAVAEELSVALEKQGWKAGAGGLKRPKNAILKFAKGAARLTIMIHPAPAGSTVKIFSEGLDWTDAGAETASNPAKSADDDVSVEDIEKKANKMLDDALKSLPGF